VRTLARPLKGVRICNINSTAAGGGVAELLSQEIPLLGALRVEADWWIIRGEEQFFTVTTGFHNALQGGQYELTEGGCAGSTRRRTVAWPVPPDPAQSDKKSGL
jgi:trehalose synthase